MAALIPARGGSIGLVRKNLARIDGVSLIGHAVRLAMELHSITTTYVSSDDPGILSEAESWGAVPVERDSTLAADETPMQDVVVDFLHAHHDVDRVVLLQPTSPLRTAEDVGLCLSALDKAPMAVTVTKSKHPVEWQFSMDFLGRLQPLSGSWSMPLRRQDAQHAYEPNGAVYAARSTYLKGGGAFFGPETVGVEMPNNRSLDIDDEVDLALARILYRTQADQRSP